MNKQNFIKNIRNLPLFFIIGRPRSGTTLLKTLFDAHPNVNIPIECPVFMALFNQYGETKYWSKKELTSFYNNLLKLKRFDFWRIDLEKLKSDILACEGKNSYETICKVVHYNYNSIFDKQEIKIIGDKNPKYSSYTKNLIDAFPNAKFIHIIRDYRAHFLSMRNADFPKAIVSLSSYLWKDSARKLSKLKNKYPNKIYSLRYEDLVNEPDFYIKQMADFLEIKYVSEVIEFYKKKDEFEKIFTKEYLERYFESLLSPINTSSTDLWKEKLSEKEIRIADAIVGCIAEKQGYDRVYKRTRLKAYIYVLQRKLFFNLYYKYRGFINILPQKLRLFLRKKTPPVVSLYLKFFKR
ncbi:MAG: sulfotransferase [Bacteroidales bacterium]|nr:sulfotransferase [Bacteroidales bacterium]